MKKIIILIPIAILAGSLSWLPDIALHFTSGKKFGIEAVFISILMPITAYLIRRILINKINHIWTTSLLMLLGLWLSGPLCMMISASASDGGFTQPNPWASLWSIYSIFPLATWMMSVYDGSMLGLLLASGVLIIKPKQDREPQQIAQPDSQ